MSAAAGVIAAMINAIKASGTIVRVEAKEFADGNYRQCLRMLERNM